MGASVVQLTESAFHEILQFVAASSRLSERGPLYDSLRQLGSGVLQLDEMVIGHCASSTDNAPRDRCSDFDPVVSLSDAPPNLPLSPCASAKSASGCGQSEAPAGRPSYEAAPSNGRVVVCHRRQLESPSLCIVSSAKERAPEELLALLKTLLPYVDDAFQRVKPDSAAPGEKADGTAACGNALTTREKEVLHWTTKGKSCWETGHIVGCSERTVKFHLQNIYRKLNVVNRAQAVARAAQINLLQVAV